MPFSRTRLQTALILLTVGLAVAGCGGGNHKVSIANGREIFQNGSHGNAACSFCHTMRAANAAGVFAPNLDQDIGEDRTRGFATAKISKLVSDILKQGLCLDPKDPSRCMPAKLVTGGDATDMTAFIVRCASRPSAAGCSAPAPASALAAKGERLFGSLRCSGCHSINGNVAVAPTVKGLAGSKVELTNGQKVTATDDYLSVAISTPDAQIVKGYKPGYMTSVIQPGAVSAAQIKALVAYIKTLK